MHHASDYLVRDDRGSLPASDIAAFGYLARYSGNTAANYQTILRVYFTWLRDRGVDPLTVHRAHIEAWGRSLEEAGRMASTVDHYLGVIIGFYKFAEIDEYVSRSPAIHVRRPKFDRDETRRLGLDRLELGSMIATAKALGPCEGAAILLMGNLGLRNAEACAVRIEDYSETLRGHRVLRVVGKGNKAASIPLPVPLLRALDSAAAGRERGHLLVRPWDDDTPLNGAAMRRLVARVAARAKIGRRVLPHELRHAMITNALDAGVPLRDVQIAARHADPRLTARYDRNRHNLDRHAVHTPSAYLAGAA